MRFVPTSSGLLPPVGRRGVEQLLEVVADPADRRPPEVARACLPALGSQLRALKAQIPGVRPPHHCRTEADRSAFCP